MQFPSVSESNTTEFRDWGHLLEMKVLQLSLRLPDSNFIYHLFESVHGCVSQGGEVGRDV